MAYLTESGQRRLWMPASPEASRARYQPFIFKFLFKDSMPYSCDKTPTGKFILQFNCTWKTVALKQCNTSSTGLHFIKTISISKNIWGMSKCRGVYCDLVIYRVQTFSSSKLVCGRTLSWIFRVSLPGTCRFMFGRTLSRLGVQCIYTVLFPPRLSISSYWNLFSWLLATYFF